MLNYIYSGYKSTRDDMIISCHTINAKLMIKLMIKTYLKV